eukprot:g16457.t1
MELQLVSLDFCRACRSTPTLRLRVHDETPQSLSLAPGAEPPIVIGWSTVWMPSPRVPRVCAMCLLWTLPVGILLRSAAEELWQWLEVLVLRGVGFEAGYTELGSLDGVVWPTSLQKLILDVRRLETPLQSMLWPAGLLTLEFGNLFNERIAGVAWPHSIKSIHFGNIFNQSLAGVVWPPDIENLCFERDFNHPIAAVDWPTKLKVLGFKGKFDQPIAEVLLSFWKYFNQPIAGVAWPASLLKVEFGERFNQPIAREVLPPALEELRLGDRFNLPIDAVVWPKTLQKIWFVNDFNQSIAGVAWPLSLRTVWLMGDFDQPITGVEWPPLLKELAFGKRFNQAINHVQWPASIQQLDFGYAFNQPIDAVQWPASLRSLKFGDRFNQPVAGVEWPASLEGRIGGATLGTGANQVGSAPSDGAAAKVRKPIPGQANPVRTHGFCLGFGADDVGLARKLRDKFAGDNGVGCGPITEGGCETPNFKEAGVTKGKSTWQLDEHDKLILPSHNTGKT